MALDSPRNSFVAWALLISTEVAFLRVAWEGSRGVGGGARARLTWRHVVADG